MDTKTLTKISLMCAVTCILAPLSVQAGPVPLSFTHIAVLLAVYLLGTKNGCISYFLYYIIGILGMPVFSGFQGGIGKALGPTGGCLIGFFLLALISGLFIGRYKNKAVQFAGMLLGDAALYAAGIPWFAVIMKTSLKQAFMTVCMPYIIADILKMIFVLILGSEIKKRMKSF